MQDALSRRLFLFHSASCVSATWVASHCPAALAAAEHAHSSAQSAAPPTFEFFTPNLAKEVDAVAARIIPTDQTPDAREAGVVYLIDRALATFASGDRKLYTEGIAEMQARAREMFSGIEKFSAATDGQQDEILRSLDERTSSPPHPSGLGPSHRSSSKRSASTLSLVFRSILIPTVAGTAAGLDGN